MAFIKKHKGNFTKKIATFSSMSKSKKINFVKYSVIMTKKLNKKSNKIFISLFYFDWQTKHNASFYASVVISIFVFRCAEPET